MDTGAEPVEKEHNEPLNDFATFLRNINEGFHTSVRNQMNADGVFLDTESELNAVANWDQWHNHKTLPDIETTDEDTLKTTTAQFENKLQEIRQGIPDQNGNRQYLHFADVAQLEKYFKLKYPAQKEHIEKIFQNFHHDLNLFGGGVDAAFSADKNLRGQFKDYRHTSMLVWQEELIELAAQELEKQPVELPFDPVEKALEVKDVFDIVSRTVGSNLKITIDRDPFAAPLATDLQFNGNPIEFKRLIKNLLRYAQDYSTDHKGLPVEQHITLSKTAEKKLTVQSIDTAGGFVGENERLINERLPASVPGRPDLVRQKAFARSEKGVNSKGSGFGLDMVWDIVVNKYNGVVKVMNETKTNAAGNKEVTGARFIMTMSPHTQPVTA